MFESRAGACPRTPSWPSSAPSMPYETGSLKPKQAFLADRRPWSGTSAACRPIGCTPSPRTTSAAAWRSISRPSTSPRTRPSTTTTPCSSTIGPAKSPATPPRPRTSSRRCPEVRGGQGRASGRTWRACWRCSTPTCSSATCWSTPASRRWISPSRWRRRSRPPSRSAARPRWRPSRQRLDAWKDFARRPQGPHLRGRRPWPRRSSSQAMAREETERRERERMEALQGGAGAPGAGAEGEVQADPHGPQDLHLQERDHGGAGRREPSRP